jgi:hypothetical protein
MEIHFHDPNELPLPPAETRISALEIVPWPDGRRVGVDVHITPFQERPNLHVIITDDQGREVASVGAMQIRETRMSFTLHLRQPETRGQYQVTAQLAYADPDLKMTVVHQIEKRFEIP